MVICLYLASAPQTVKESIVARNQTNESLVHNISNIVAENRDALLRSFYVFGGLCLIALLYLGFRTLRLHRRRTGRRTGTRKYLPLKTRGQETHELEPFSNGGEDEDEDTLFDTSTHQAASA